MWALFSISGGVARVPALWHDSPNGAMTRRSHGVRGAHRVRALSNRTADPARAMTERLYYTDAYCTQFEARVLETLEGERRRIYLDRTAFYPTSGGQPHDTGRLNGATVIDVIDEGERIAHVVEEHRRRRVTALSTGRAA